MREKLIELLSVVTCPNKICNFCEHSDDGFACERHRNEVIADHLIANGVTIQKWIPVSERLPESQKIVLVSAKEKTFGYRHTLMAAHIGHHEATTEDSGWQEYDGDTEYDEERDCFWIPECWWEVNAVDGNENWILDSEYEVTHWMPLPVPPKEG